MINPFAFTIILFSLFACQSQRTIYSNSYSSFTASHAGEYKGSLTIYKDNQVVRSLPMQFNLLKTDTADWFKWQVQYDTQAMRDYRLRTINQKSGSFEVDELNGITLPAHLNKGVLSSYFTIVQSTLLVTYDFRIKDEITFQVHAYGKQASQYTGQSNTEIDSIGLYSFAGYQEAVLKKVK